VLVDRAKDVGGGERVLPVSRLGVDAHKLLRWIQPMPGYLRFYRVVVRREGFALDDDLCPTRRGSVEAREEQVDVFGE